MVLVANALDNQNKAHFMAVVIRNWLAIRLDMFGNFLILGISLFSVAQRASVYPSKIGVVLSYSLQIAAVMSDVVNQFATVEQNMNTVERVQHYAEDLPQEANAELPGDAELLGRAWPQHGAIRFKDVNFRYRENLPLALKGV